MHFEGQSIRFFTLHRLPYITTRAETFEFEHRVESRINSCIGTPARSPESVGIFCGKDSSDRQKQ